MAINLTDFDKIWASSSPLTPYSFSDANYEEGWNFVGATPPARQMWDGYMKWSDEKQQYIVQNFLPLAGGTMTGSVVTDSPLKTPTDDTVLGVYGSTEYTNGGALQVFGKDHATFPGWFSIRASDNVDNKIFVGKPDGTLTWNNNDISGNLEDFTSKITFNETYSRASFLRVGRLCVVMYQGESKTHAVNDVIFTVPTAYRPQGVVSSQYHIVGRYNNNVGGFCFNGNGEFYCAIGDTNTARIYVQFSYFI